MNRGKSINLFLIEGEVTGPIKCKLTNWTGVIYRIPRNKLTLEETKNRNDLRKSGVYFLIGKDEDTGRDLVYIGQAGTRKNGEGILFRILEHARNEKKNYFNEVIIVVTSDDSYGPTEISYLENKFTILAKEINRYEVQNGNEPCIGNVTEEKQAELDEFIENSKMIIGALGHKIFVPLVKQKIVLRDEEFDDLKLFLNRKIKNDGHEIKAQILRTSEGFVVLKGSMIEIPTRSSLKGSLVNLRKSLIDSGIIKNGILLEDQIFNSPSYAASFVLGMPTNGRTALKDINGKSLKEIELEELK